jgi:serine/threonine-protein kinase
MLPASESRAGGGDASPAGGGGVAAVQVNCCPNCQRLYPADGRFCPIDGKPLKPVADVEVPKDPEDKRIGATLCGKRYQVRRKVADGGMGRVYQALDTKEGRSVALKVLHPEVASDEVALERFRREYEFSSQLPHAHIVEVLDFQRTEDHSYALVMEYLEGEELRMQLQRQNVQTPARLLRVLSQLAIGLEEPHKRRLVHRDIKPDNIFLCGTEEGPRVKLLDFGSVRDNTAGAKKLTVVGTTIGSPFYMAPEQAQGLPDLDHRADVWSIAAIAYECLTGKVPFPGSTGPQILLSILGREAEPPTIAAPDRRIPPEIDDVMGDALAKNPKTRIASVGELADRFGHAFAVEGSHREWAYLPEVELARRMSEGLRQREEVRTRMAMQISSPGTGGPLTADATGPQPPSSQFRDDEFVMGVPAGPPKALYIGIAVAGLVVVGVVVVVVLLL